MGLQKSDRAIRVGLQDRVQDFLVFLIDLALRIDFLNG
jgi:hypothetical protein